MGSILFTKILDSESLHALTLVARFLNRLARGNLLQDSIQVTFGRWCVPAFPAEFMLTSIVLASDLVTVQPIALTICLYSALATFCWLSSSVLLGHEVI